MWYICVRKVKFRHSRARTRVPNSKLILKNTDFSNKERRARTKAAVPTCCTGPGGSTVASLHPSKAFSHSLSTAGAGEQGTSVTSCSPASRR